MSETKITKNYFIPFLDVARDMTGEAPNWTRIDKSTVFALAANPQTNDYDYICYAGPQTELESYKPSMDQEIATYRGNAMYDFIFSMYFDLDITEANVPALLVFPAESDAANTLPAWNCPNAQVVLNELNAVDGKITFTINFGGDIERGTVAVTNGRPVFTVDAAP